MDRIKTRKKAERMRAQDLSPILGQRMRDAFLHSKQQIKRQSEHLSPTDQTTPSECAAEQVQDALEDSIASTVSNAITAVELAVQYKKRVTRQKKKAAAKTRGPVLPLEVPALSDELVPTAPEALHLVDRPTGRAVQNFQRQSGVNLTPALVHGRELTIERSVKRIGTARQLLDTPASIQPPLIKTREYCIENPPGFRTAKPQFDLAGRRVKTAGYSPKAAAKPIGYTVDQATWAAHTATKTTKRTVQTSVNTVGGSAKAIRSIGEAVAGTVRTLMAAIAAGGGVAVMIVVLICLIGAVAGSCFGIFFSGTGNGTGLPLSTVVREINQSYTDRLEEIKADNPHDVLELSGACAVWPEVLAVYAVRTAADPNHPQAVAVMDGDRRALLEDIFWQMNELHYRIDSIPAETDDNEESQVLLSITVSRKTAGEMADKLGFTADQRRQLAELLAEENRSMWASVLYGLGTGDSQIVTVALSQIGNVGGQPYWSWYGFDSRVEWCACFVSWCANECGYIDASIVPKFAGPETAVQWFKERGLWQDTGYEPRPGDIIFFDWDSRGSSGPQNGFPNHVGIVEKVEDGMVYTVEGNTGDSCKERRYAVGHYEILGYGTPAY